MCILFLHLFSDFKDENYATLFQESFVAVVFCCRPESIAVVINQGLDKQTASRYMKEIMSFDSSFCFDVLKYESMKGFRH